MAWVGIQSSGPAFTVEDAFGTPLDVTWDGSAIVGTDTSDAPAFTIRGPAGTRYRLTVESFSESTSASGYAASTASGDTWTPAQPAQTGLTTWEPSQAVVTSTDGTLSVKVP